MLGSQYSDYVLYDDVSDRMWWSPNIVGRQIASNSGQDSPQVSEWTLCTRDHQYQQLKTHHFDSWFNSECSPTISYGSSSRAGPS